MSALIQSLFSYPVVVFTALLGVALLYWLSVMFGALDVDVLDADGAFDGGADGALEGAADGAFDGAADGALDGAADGAFDGAADGAFEGGAEGAVEGLEGAVDGIDADGAADGLSGLLTALNLRRAPVTVVFSIVVFLGWVTSYVAARTVLPMVSTLAPQWLSATLVLVLSLAVALPLTSLITKPIEPLFRTTQASRRRDFVGQVCRISTGRVDAKFGQATLEDGGAGLLIQVRGEGNLKRGARALIVDFDAEREAYLVEAYDEMLRDDAGQ